MISNFSAYLTRNATFLVPFSQSTGTLILTCNILTECGDILGSHLAHEQNDLVVLYKVKIQRMNCREAILR